MITDGGINAGAGPQSHDKSTQHIKKHRYHFTDKGPNSQRFYQLSCMNVRVFFIKKTEHQTIHGLEL